MYDVAGSIVVFKNEKETLKRAIASFFDTALNTYLYLIDNSPRDELRDVCSGKNMEYIFNRNNLGFAAGHNIALRKMIGKTKYSLLLNPDVYFDKGTIDALFNFMEHHPEVGSVMPKVLYPDGSLQYLCRLLPTPYDLLFRKLNSRILNPLVNLLSKYELRFADYEKMMDVPYLSGCFMFVRTDVFEKVGTFDERFFLYFEDVDLSRRIHKLYRTVYYPYAAVYHSYQRDSNRDAVILKRLIESGIKYFNKWGWFSDMERKQVNRETIRNLYRLSYV
ncbi:MAG: glycosyltransferase family 2 protein [Candidatus Omnitrophica bacterium]|nr:glycosyltransferase family 2 protein [Candidatus Omnitrophota bacterium]